MDIAQLARSIGLTSAEYRGLIKLFLATSRNDLARVRQALDDNAFQSGAEAAHSLKGAALGMGFGPISRSAQRLENHLRQALPDQARKELPALDRALCELAESAGLENLTEPPDSPTNPAS